jgi:hypothetical protein
MLLVGRLSALDEWLSLLGRIVGLAGLAAFGIKWLATGETEPVLVSVFGVLYGISKAGQAAATLRDKAPLAPPTPQELPSGGKDRPTDAEGP